MHLEEGLGGYLGRYQYGSRSPCPPPPASAHMPCTTQGSPAVTHALFQQAGGRDLNSGDSLLPPLLIQVPLGAPIPFHWGSCQAPHRRVPQAVASKAPGPICPFPHPHFQHSPCLYLSCLRICLLQWTVDFSALQTGVLQRRSNLTQPAHSKKH